MSDHQEIYIYESPDGGESVYRRRSGSLDRELIKESATVLYRHKKLFWNRILSEAADDPILDDLLKQVETYYTLKYHAKN